MDETAKIFWNDTAWCLLNIFSKIVVPSITIAATALCLIGLWFIASINFMLAGGLNLNAQAMPWGYLYLAVETLFFCAVYFAVGLLGDRKKYKLLWIPFIVGVFLFSVNTDLTAHLRKIYPPQKVEASQNSLGELPPGME